MSFSTRLAERARSAGVDVVLELWEDMIHVWHFFASMLPKGQQAVDPVGESIRERVSGGQQPVPKKQRAG
jgi:monoterpene epsilon-lactone hydrolase